MLKIKDFYFNPIIVLFLTQFIYIQYLLYIFQSYYSLISNKANQASMNAKVTNFNPIIVLFLTDEENWEQYIPLKFQSYYSLISNTIKDAIKEVLAYISILL